jgi:hypothetical protein
MLLNLTPHDIVVRIGGVDRVYLKSGRVARVVTATVPAGTVAGIPVFHDTAGVVEGLEYDQAGQIVPCLVSGMVLAALPAGTKGVYAPATGPNDGAIRNEKGHIVAVVALKGL